MKLVRIFIKLRKWIWSPLLAFIERKLNPEKYKKGTLYLASLKEECETVDEYIKFIRERNFKWAQDALGGFIDFTSYPEITIAKGEGDCDDLARLAVEILKDKFKEVYELYCFKGLFMN